MSPSGSRALGAPAKASARLADKYGSEIEMAMLLSHLAGGCSFRDTRRGSTEFCGAYYPDMSGEAARAANGTGAAEDRGRAGGVDASTQATRKPKKIPFHTQETRVMAPVALQCSMPGDASVAAGAAEVRSTTCPASPATSDQKFMRQFSKRLDGSFHVVLASESRMHFEVTAENPLGGTAIIGTEDPREALSSIREFEAAAFNLIQVRLGGRLVSMDALVRLADNA